MEVGMGIRAMVSVMVMAMEGLMIVLLKAVVVMAMVMGLAGSIPCGKTCITTS